MRQRRLPDSKQAVQSVREASAREDRPSPASACEQRVFESNLVLYDSRSTQGGPNYLLTPFSPEITATLGSSLSLRIIVCVCVCTRARAISLSFLLFQPEKCLKSLPSSFSTK